MVTKQQITDAVRSLGVQDGDILLTHSSFKSLGICENGADTVIDGLAAAVGDEGTLVFPTLCKDDWKNIYKNWNLDATSFVGYLTNYFRKLDGVIRSDQATHSVAARGKDAAYLTETHGKSGLRYGLYGDTPFAADSPWQKMYEKNAKTLFLGCSISSCTFRHLAEYILMDEYLKRAEKSPEYEELKRQVWCYDRFDEGGIWPHTSNVFTAEVLDAEGKLKRTTCGDATLILVEARDFVDTTIRLLREHEERVFRSAPPLHTREANIAWMKKIEALS